ncbi:hypothetical protein GGP91_000217 [Salinibacter ruber]|uniref:hypothetical protein n=1 Tax=Salinibacter ruber TaxID=146919 RepID=UPI002073E3A3|nr:hypothetical protein [Salinibacter ruber]MCS3631356.1 hypothetical protein [Salinibacter ruber]MCS3828172.1 hypothetical protein [Salinibacter ruber]MCS4056077.1 hypothetical protein [Salinibacter ruber]MCS4058972.1 hypothetical protein [Salinibacter ruber]MCS4099425.1 hypothetical protein [Salinibacter ruber]
MGLRPVALRRLVGLASVLLLAGGAPPSGATDRDVAGAYEQVFQAALETPERRPFPIEKAEAAVGKALGNSAIYDAYLDAIAERAADLQGDG